MSLLTGQVLKLRRMANSFPSITTNTKVGLMNTETITTLREGRQNQVRKVQIFGTRKSSIYVNKLCMKDNDPLLEDYDLAGS